jgi:hypothetical protein
MNRWPWAIDTRSPHAHSWMAKVYGCMVMVTWIYGHLRMDTWPCLSGYTATCTWIYGHVHIDTWPSAQDIHTVWPRAHWYRLCLHGCTATCTWIYVSHARGGTWIHSHLHMNTWSYAHECMAMSQMDTRPHEHEYMTKCTWIHGHVRMETRPRAHRHMGTWIHGHMHLVTQSHALRYMANCTCIQRHLHMDTWPRVHGYMATCTWIHAMCTWIHGQVHMDAWSCAHGYTATCTNIQYMATCPWTHGQQWQYTIVLLTPLSMTHQWYCKDTAGSGINGVFSKIMCQMSRELAAVLPKTFWVWTRGVRKIYGITNWSSNSFWDCLCNYQEFGVVSYGRPRILQSPNYPPPRSLGDLIAPHLYLLGLSAPFRPTRSAIQFSGNCNHCNFSFLRKL